MPTAREYITRAVPSLMRLSARSRVTFWRGKALARTPTAVASVGASAAPSTHAAPHGRPNVWAVTATAAPVRMTSAVLMSTMPRRLARISRSEVVRLSQNSNAGRNRTSTTSGGRRTCRSAGRNPASAPAASSRIGDATRRRVAAMLQPSTATPRTTTSSRPSTASDYPRQPASEPCPSRAAPCESGRVGSCSFDGDPFHCPREQLFRRVAVLLDDRDSDVSSFEARELVEGGVVGAEVDDLVGVSDAGGVVVEAEVPPRREVDEVAVFGVGSRCAVGVEGSGEVADLLPAVELLETQREREHGQEVADGRVVRSDGHVDG